MSPLWSDMALAQAAWANAVERGLVDAGAAPKQPKDAKQGRPRDLPRRPIRRAVTSFAL